MEKFWVEQTEKGWTVYTRNGYPDYTTIEIATYKNKNDAIWRANHEQHLLMIDYGS